VKHKNELSSQEKRDFFDVTEEDRAVILKLLAIGHTRAAVAKTMRIRPTKFYSWLKKGKHERPQNCYRQFYESVVQAEGEAQIILERVVIEAARERVSEAKWLLQNRFGVSDKVTMTREAREELDVIKVKQAEETLRLTKARVEIMQRKGGEVTPKMWAAMFNSMTEDEESMSN
tara:strand:+ start:549 stop:1070 length:522 start_codon:yes stop_codon:yes gene_type:complete